MKRLILISIMLFISLTCFSQKREWEKAHKVNTIESYQNFIDEFPESPLVKEANLILSELEFKKVESENNSSSYKGFIIKYPNSIFVNKVKEKLKEFERLKIEKEEIIKNQIIKIKGYTIGEFTEEQFNNDGWNVKDPHVGKIGIVKQIRQNGKLISTYMGYWDYYSEAVGNSAQTSYNNYLINFDDEIKSVWTFHKPDETLKLICKLNFNNGVLSKYFKYKQ